MRLGLNAGFGEPLAQDLAAIASLGFSFVRQDVRFHHSDAHIRTLLSEFVGTPLVPLVLLAGGHIDKPGGGRVEPHEIAGLGTRVVVAALTVGLPDYMIEVGNEPDLAHVDYRTQPDEFGEAVSQTCQAVRAQGFAGPIVSGGISNLGRPSLQYLEQMLIPGLPDDLIIGFHRYPDGMSPKNPQKGFESRAEEWQELLRLAGTRRVACTEVGHHTAPRKYRLWGFIPWRGRVKDKDVAEHMLYDLRFFEDRDCYLATVYQLNDGPSADSHHDRYGIRRQDGSLKPVALAIRDEYGQA